MIEEVGKFEGQKAWITRPTPTDKVTQELTASWWHSNDGENYEPAKFTCDPDIIKRAKEIPNLDEFLKEFLQIANKYQYESILTPMLRRKVDQEKDRVYYERSHENSSVITEEDRSDQLEQGGAPTSWDLVFSEHDLKCVCHMASYCVVIKDEHL